MNTYKVFIQPSTLGDKNEKNKITLYFFIIDFISA